MVRDQFYNGNLKQERSAVVLRLSPSWFRFGSLEILSKNQEYELLQQLVDFVIKHHFRHIDVDDKNRVLEMYSDIVTATANMIASWQSVGFVHGVMNTDNFSLLSLTIDYGPFQFMDAYDPELVPNTSDDEHRYSYEKQPDVGAYNLDKLKLALYPILSTSQRQQINIVFLGYVPLYKDKFMKLFRKKLAIDDINETDVDFVRQLLYMMEMTRSDFTMTFRDLGDWTLIDMKAMFIPNKLWSLQKLKRHKDFKKWIKVYIKKLEREGVSDAKRRDILRDVNPRYVLRNWMAQQAIEGVERGDFTVLKTIQRILQTPFKESDEAEKAGFAKEPPPWAQDIRVSCSS